jgi:hypothetical protein
MNKLYIAILSYTICVSAQAKNVYSGDVVGRELNIPPLWAAGHVGIATGDWVGSTTNLVIEALKDTPVIQLNSLVKFKSMSKYWGGRYGIGDYADGTRHALVEANHQRWWCPKYTTSTSYKIGTGNLETGQPTSCGTWRCDTFVAWSFFSAGYYQLMNNKIMLPRNVFYSFPYADDELDTVAPEMTQTDKDFTSLTATELNNLSFEDFEMIADIPAAQQTPTHVAAEWHHANDTSLNDVKRGIFIDRLAMSNDLGVIARFLDMYKVDASQEIKTKLIQGLMIYYQSHKQNLLVDEVSRLQNFYARMLYQDLVAEDKDMIVRGYIDFHKPEEVLVNRKQIDKQLQNIEPHLLLGIQQTLVHASPELETIYIPRLLATLKKANSTDLDDMFFSITKMGYKHLRHKESLEQIKTYLNEVASKYNAPTLTDDAYYTMAQMSYNDLEAII